MRENWHRTIEFYLEISHLDAVYFKICLVWMTFIEIRKRRWLGLCRLIKTTLIPLERRMLLAMLLNLVLASFVFLSFIRDGSAGITSSFIRSEWPAVDIPLDHEAFAVPKGYNAPQQVTLSNITSLILLVLLSIINWYYFMNLWWGS